MFEELYEKAKGKVVARALMEGRYGAGKSGVAFLDDDKLVRLDFAKKTAIVMDPPFDVSYINMTHEHIPVDMGYDLVRMIDIGEVDPEYVNQVLARVFRIEDPAELPAEDYNRMLATAWFKINEYMAQYMADVRVDVKGDTFVFSGV